MTATIINEWFVLVNPTSGNGKGKRFWEKKIKNKLEESGLSFKWGYSQYEGHAIVCTVEAIKKGYRNFIVVGGDGTHNEIVNGILRQKIVDPLDITLATIPLGTGNDWIKTMRIPTNIDKAIDIIKNGKTYIHDTGLITYYNGKKKAQRYFLNVAGLGFDAYVAQRMTNTKKYGKLSYFIALAGGLLGFKNIEVVLKSKTKKMTSKIFTVNVGIGKYFGSGMKITPNAIPNDGLFDITVIKDVTKLEVISELGRLYKGTFVKHPKIEIFRTPNISIASDVPIYVQADGELLGHVPVNFEIVPQTLKVMVSQSYN
jgi:diacylglycerol kinase (ATP)